MATYLQERNATANILGRTDGATANTLRDNAINDVRQNEIANAYPFSWLEKKDATIATGSSGAADLPADFNNNHKPKDVRIVNSGQSDDYIFNPVNKEAFDAYAASDYVYYIDYNTSTNRWRINTHNTSVTLTIIYYHIPAALSDGADIDIIPDKDVIALLAGARVWLASERDETNFDRFKALGERKLNQLIDRDKKARPKRLSRGASYTVNQGWNVL